MTTHVGDATDAQRVARSSPAVHGVAGIAILVVMLQSTGGFTVELLGPDLLLVVAGFSVTHAVLDQVGSTGGPRLARWYREQVGFRAPLLLVMLAAVLAVAALVGEGAQVARRTLNVLAGLWPPLWSGVGPPARSIDGLDPLGHLWLIGLLIIFGLMWPALVFAAHVWLRRAYGDRAPTVLATVLLSSAIAFWLVGRLRWLSGADLVELAIGGHVRFAEWLVGAAAAAVVVGMRPAGSARSSWLAETLLPSRWFAYALVILGVTMLVAMAVTATWQPEYWLGLGGPACAAGATAAVLLALHLPTLDGPARALGRGLPLELGRMAYPLLVLHIAVFWMVQLAFPGARPFALLVVGGALAWLCGLLIHDGVIRRWQARGTAFPRGIGVLVLVVLVAGVVVVLGGAGSSIGLATVATDRPAVLVVGGSTAGELADALGRQRGQFAVVDGSRPTCGLRATTPATGRPARTTALAQVPAAEAICGDWPESWAALTEATRPIAVVADLSADAAPRALPSDPTPCDPAFRREYRSLVERAVGVLSSGAPGRPVLLTTVRDDGGDSSVRCLNALVAESASSYRQVALLDVNGQLCPDGVCRTHTLDGEPLYLPNGRPSPAALAELGTWLETAVTGSLAGRG